MRPVRAARQLRHVRVLLLRHDAGAGGEGVVDLDEARTRRVDQRTISSASRDRCMAQMAAQARNSATKSRSDTASMLLRLIAANSSSCATDARSIG